MSVEAETAEAVPWEVTVEQAGHPEARMAAEGTLY